MKKILIYLSVMALLVAGNAPLASAAADNLRIASGVVGSMVYTLATGTAAVYQKHTGQTLEVLTKEVSATVQELYEGRYELAATTNAAPWFFYYNINPQTLEPMEKKNRPPMRIVMMGNIQTHGLLTYADTGMTKASQLQGKRVAYGHGQYSVQLTARASLLTAGLTGNVTIVRASNIPQAAEQLQRGGADATHGAISASVFRELDAGRKVRFLTLEPTPEAHKALRDFFPGAVLVDVEPGPGLIGIPERTTLFGTHNCMVSATNIADDVIYKFVKTIYENRADLAPFSQDFVDWQKELPVSTYATAPFHPGAIRYYKEAGLWTPEVDAWNQHLLDLYKED